MVIHPNEETGSCSCGNSNNNNTIITVEELERRKDRFRRATKDYYEQAERNFRSLHGFCTAPHNKNNTNHKNNHNKNQNNYTIGSKRMRSEGQTGTGYSLPRLKRCRRSRTAMAMHHHNHNRRKQNDLEVHLARCLLVSSFEIVQVAIEEYLESIRGLVRIVPQWWWRYLDPPPPPRHATTATTTANDATTNETTAGPHNHPLLTPEGGGESFLLSLPSSLPLPLLFATTTNQTADADNECLVRLLHRHLSEAIEEEHMAMASSMIAVRETKLTLEHAKTIHNGIESIQWALRKVSVGVAAHGNSILYGIHYDIGGGGDGGVETGGDAATTTPQQQPPFVTAWKRSVVEARKLDGYFRWFRANNGVLLVNNNISSGDGDDDEDSEAEAAVAISHHPREAMGILDGPRNLLE